jgi:hypothetical protein
MAPSAPTDVVLVIVDACRADRAPGGSAAAMPRLAARAGAQGWVTFPRAYAAAPWTLPSCTSLLSGVPPWVHGRYTHQGPLPFPMLAERLSGPYDTAAFVNNTNMHPSSGMDAGFGRYELSAGHDEPFEAAARWWRAPADRPRFMLVHTNLVHDFYKPAGLASLDPAVRSTLDAAPLGANVVSWRRMDPTAVAAQQRVYDACVAAADERLDSLLEVIDPERTVIAVCSDHGEGLDPARGRVHHGGRLHEDLMGAMLTIGVPAGRRAEVGERLGALAAAPFALTRLPALLVAVAGVPDTGHPALGDGLAPLGHCDAEDRRYLYVRNRLRLNVNRAGKNTSLGQRLQNRALQTVITDFAIAARVEGDAKVVVTRFALAGPVRGRGRAERLLAAVLGRPVTLVPDGTGNWLDLQGFDLAADPAEERNLIEHATDPVTAAVSLCPSLTEVPLAVGGRTWTPPPVRRPVGAASGD